MLQEGLRHLDFRLLDGDVLTLRLRAFQQGLRFCHQGFLPLHRLLLPTQVDLGAFQFAACLS